MIIDISPKQFRAIVSTGIVASKSDVAPLLAGVQISRTDNVVEAVATDRYRVARITFECHGDDFVAVIPAEVLSKFWASIKVEALRSQAPVRLGVEDTGYTLGYGYSSVLGQCIAGKFPDVSKLVLEAKERESVGVPQIALNPTYVGDMAKLFHPVDNKKPEVDWRFSFNLSDTGKPAPVYATRSGDMGGTLEYLLQPMMLRG